MIITKKGYELNFIQTEKCNDNTPHKFTSIFAFYSPITKLKYIIRAEFHEPSVFAVKFYAQKHSKSERKYNIITNKGDAINILITTAKVVPYLLKEYPCASFSFTGSRTIERNKYVENAENNQRFIVYTGLCKQLIRNETFAHFLYPKISAYILQ